MQNRDTVRIQAVLDELSRAIRDRDAKAAVALYDEDAVAYDLAPPLAIEGRALLEPAGMEEWFETWASPIESKARDLEIHVSGDVAFAFALRRMTGTKKSGENVDLWFRATAGFVRRGGEWKIAHVHNSVPFAMDGSQRALLELEP